MQLSNLLSRLNTAIGSSIPFQESTRISALNRARRQMLLDYDFFDFLKEEDIDFVSGVGDKPTDYLKDSPQPQRSLYNATTNKDYEKVVYELFDENVSYLWTEFGGNFLIAPADTVTLKFRYFSMPIDMINQTDDSGFGAMMDDSHVDLAVAFLFEWDRQLEMAQAKESIARKRISDILARQQKNYGYRPLSVYERHSLSYGKRNII